VVRDEEILPLSGRVVQVLPGLQLLVAHEHEDGPIAGKRPECTAHMEDDEETGRPIIRPSTQMISKQKRLFSFQQNWTLKVFRISKFLRRSLRPVHKLEELRGESKDGQFYAGS
jgi:hypothetical protein